MHSPKSLYKSTALCNAESCLTYDGPWPVLAKGKVAFIRDFVLTPVPRLRDLTTAITTDGIEVGQVDMARTPIPFYKQKMTRTNLVMRCEVASLSVSCHWDERPINFRFCGVSVYKSGQLADIKWPVRQLDAKAPVAVIVQSTKDVIMIYKGKKMLMSPGTVMMASYDVMKQTGFTCSVEFGLVALGQIKT